MKGTFVVIYFIEINTSHTFGDKNVIFLEELFNGYNALDECKL